MTYAEYTNRYLSRSELESPNSRQILESKYWSREMPSDDAVGFVRYLTGLAVMLRERLGWERGER
jgi:hypothetical protein